MTALLSVGVLLTAAAGCGRLDRAAGSFEPTQQGVLSVATAEVPAPGLWEGTATDPSGGFEYELARELAERFELEALEVEIVPFGELVSGELGGADLALSLITPTGEREQVLDFSTAYLRAPPSLLTDASLELPDLESARELSYAVQEETTLEEILGEQIDPTGEVEVLASSADVVEALVDGEVDAALFDLPFAAALAERSDGELAVAAKLDSNETIAVALPEGEAENAEAVSGEIRAMIADGTLRDLAERWLGAAIAERADEVPLLRSGR